MKKGQKPKILIFAILTTMTILTWIVFEVWRAFTHPFPIQVESEIIEPLNPQIDTQTLENLKTKIFFSDEEARRGGVSTATQPAGLGEGEQ